MYRLVLCIIFAVMMISCQNLFSPSNPKNDMQSTNDEADNTNYTDPSIDRVAIAKKEKSVLLEENLAKHNLSKTNLQILIIAYKNTDELLLYAKNKDDKKYSIIKSYPICSRSGILGPKKAEGDKQVPEGFYHINRFNEKSLFYLSLGINYPNSLDQSLGYTGSDIFIHGKCATTGCLPMTDDLIKEIYLYALTAKDAGQQKIPVYIFPFPMTDANLKKHQDNVDATTLSFWKNIQVGYQRFQSNKQALDVDSQNGKYIFK